MIQEAYVSFDVAKLLKEKGFDQETIKRYDPSGELYSYYQNVTVIPKGEAYVCAPTQQMACEWLRQEHNLSVEVYRTACGYIGCIVAVPSGTDIKFLEEDGDDLASGQYTKWEYACEAAIKYCLENLI